MGQNVIIHGKDSTDVLSNDAGKVKTSPVLVTSGSAHIEMQAGSLWAYGNWPSTVVSQVEFTAGAADNAILYTSADISMYNYHIIENTDTSVPLDIYVSIDGTNFNPTAATVELLDDVTTGGGIKVVSIPTLKIGVLKGKFAKIRCLQVGAGTCDGRILHGVV